METKRQLTGQGNRGSSTGRGNVKDQSREETTDPPLQECTVCVCVCVCSQSCMTLWNPKDCKPPSSSVRGIFQARILEWVAISFSRGSYRTRDRTRVSCVSSVGKWVLYPCTTWEALNTIIYLLYDSHLQIHHLKKFLDYGDGIYFTLRI